MPFHRSLQSLLSAERFADRQARIEQDEQVRLAVQAALVKRQEREAERALYSTFGRDVSAIPQRRAK